MVALEQVAYESAVDYRELVIEVLKRSIDRSHLKKTQFAAALSRELEATSGRRPINPVQISKWLNSTDMPKADILLASLKIAGFDHAELLARLDPFSSPEARYGDLDKRLRALEDPPNQR